MKKRTAWVLVAGVAAVSIGAAAVGALALLLRGRGGSTSWTGKTYLYVDLGEEIPEQPPAAELGSFLEKRPPSLRTLVESMDRAAGDPKVSALLLRVSVFPDAGWGKVQELRDAVSRFRKKGKPAYAYIELSGNKEYYLASACDKIYAVPTALLDVTGLSAEVTFFRKTLDKLGVQAQFEGVGKYKNAPNQFTETGFTDPHREQMDALLDSLYEQFVKAIAEGRGRSFQEVQRIVDSGPYDGRTALKAGLVDELLYEDQIEEKVQNLGRVTPGRYVRSLSRGFGFDTRPKVALVFAVGEIVPGESHGGPFGGEGTAGSETVAGAIRRARNDDDIRAIVLRVDSPGGSGTASDVIWREVIQARKRKPVVVSMGDYAASGGYYISMGSDAIVAQPGTLTGSIGVFGGKFSLRGLYDKIGVSREILTRGENAAFFTEYRPWNDAERRKIRGLMEAFYRDFVTKAAEGRQKTYDEIHALAQGRVWTGAEAHRIGLVDHLGGFDVALSVAKQKAGIKKDQDVALVILPERKGLLETFLERQEDGVSLDSIPRDIRALLRCLTVLSQGEPLARLPFDLVVR
jgi:protease IV